MLYQCCQDARVIDIPIKLYFIYSDSELNALCIQGHGTEISNPWYGSYAETHGVIMTPEEMEMENERQYEENDLIIADLNVEPDYWES